MNTHWLVLAIAVIGLAAVIGFFRTKTEGFGRFTTSTLLLLLVLVFSCLLYAGEKMDITVVSNLLFAVVGFAGGLFAPREKPSDSGESKR